MSRKLNIQKALATKHDVYQIKKMAVKYADVTMARPKAIRTMGANKAVYENDEEKGILKRTVVGNTYLWLDSHDDVHMPGIFSKSLRERGKDAPHLHDHIFQLTAKVGRPFKIYEDDIAWAALGVQKSGRTEGLLMDTEIVEAYNHKIYKGYLEDEINQHSVSMRYITLDFAADDEDFEEDYKNYKSTVDLLGNSEEAEEKGYFWVIREAALIEISAVLAGSNVLTPTLSNKGPAPATLEMKTEESFSLSETIKKINW